MELRQASKIGIGRTAEVYAWGEGRVLKLFHEWVPEDWVAREQRGTAVAHDAGLPAPAVLGVETVEGRRGLVLERIDGRSLLGVLRERPWRAAWVARTLAEVQAALHARRVTSPGMPTIREHLRSFIDSSALSADLQRRAQELVEHLPDGDVLCHYDLHPDNVLLTHRGPVVIDWMAAAVGHPLADVARTLLLMRVGGGPGRLESQLRAFVRSVYLRRYLRLTGASRAGVTSWELPVGVARLSERIEVERPSLLAWLERLAA